MSTKCTVSTTCTEVEAVSIIGVSDAREHLSEAVGRVRYTHERFPYQSLRGKLGV